MKRKADIENARAEERNEVYKNEILSRKAYAAYNESERNKAL